LHYKYRQSRPVLILLKKMGKRKHKHDPSGDAESAEYESSKRLRQISDNYAKNIKHGRVDPTFGQRSAIPGLDDDDGEFAIGGDNDNQDPDLDYGDSVDALSYLRAVRYAYSLFPTRLQREAILLEPR
jgi:hypothetical protein